MLSKTNWRLTPSYITYHIYSSTSHQKHTIQTWCTFGKTILNPGHLLVCVASIVFVFESGMYCICIGKAGHTGPDCDRWCHQGAAQWRAALHHLPLIRKHRYTNTKIQTIQIQNIYANSGHRRAGLHHPLKLRLICTHKYANRNMEVQIYKY